MLNWRGKGVILTAVTLLALAFSCRPAAAGETNLTGTWACDDGGTYYLRQVGDRVWWLGKSGNDGQDWTNVLHGTIRGREVVGDWADVPQGGAANSGQLTLRLVVRDGRVVEIEKRRQVGDGFGGGVWRRLE